MTAGDQGGYVIDGRFELLQRLGGGGMGLVWRARDLMLQREVALKEVRSPDASVYGSDPSEAFVVRERVLREAQALARLHHPNVVTIYHIVDSRELAHPWLVMELVTGGSLEGRLERGPLGVAEAARIGRGVLAALRAAHAAGIQHRDVKPANVLLRADGTPVLTDFGIAALQETPGLTATGMLIGSPEYMAPERVHGREGDPASDLWSLGLMLYVGLEGHNPLRRETTIATIAAVAEANVPPPSRAGALTPVLGALLVRDPALRPSGEQLEWLLAEAERNAGGGPVAPAAWPSTAQTMQYQGTVSTTDQTPMPGTNPVINPYGATGQAAQPKRKNNVVAYATSAVFAIGLSGSIMWMAHTFDSPAVGNQATTVGGAVGAPPGAASGGSVSGGSVPGDAATGPGAQPPATTDKPVSASALFTPAGIRDAIQKVFKLSGGNRIFGMTVYDDGHAEFQVIKKDDPRVWDYYDFRDGQALFSMRGQEMDPQAPAIDPTKINWDALPKLLQDGAATLKVANPNLRYVVIESDIITYVPSMDLYLSNDPRSGYLEADLTGKILRRFPDGS